MKIAIAQQNYHVGNFEEEYAKNTRRHREGKDPPAPIWIIFSELCVCGYPPRDFLEFDDFYRAILRCRRPHPRTHADTIGVIIGGPARNPQREGKDLFNAAWLLYEKEIKGVAHKTCHAQLRCVRRIPLFRTGLRMEGHPLQGKKIALTICEDIWNLGDNPLIQSLPHGISSSVSIPT